MKVKGFFSFVPVGEVRFKACPYRYLLCLLCGSACYGGASIEAGKHALDLIFHFFSFLIILLTVYHRFKWLSRSFFHATGFEEAIHVKARVVLSAYAGEGYRQARPLVIFKVRRFEDLCDLFIVLPGHTATSRVAR